MYEKLLTCFKMFASSLTAQVITWVFQVSQLKQVKVQLCCLFPQNIKPLQKNERCVLENWWLVLWNTCEITAALSWEKTSALVHTQILLCFVKLNISENEKAGKVRKKIPFWFNFQGSLLNLLLSPQGMFCFLLLCVLLRVLVCRTGNTKQYICRIINKKTKMKCYWIGFHKFLHGIVSQLMEMEDWIIGLNAAGIQSYPNFPFETSFESRYFCFPDCLKVERN